MKFFVDFNGYCSIDADSKEEAEEKFWKGLQTPSKYAYDDVYDIDGVEKDDKEDQNDEVSSSNGS